VVRAVCQAARRLNSALEIEIPLHVINMMAEHEQQSRVERERQLKRKTTRVLQSLAPSPRAWGGALPTVGMAEESHAAADVRPHQSSEAATAQETMLHKALREVKDEQMQQRELLRKVRRIGSGLLQLVGAA
jgi:hypothetical protein